MIFVISFGIIILVTFFLTLNNRKALQELEEITKQKLDAQTNALADLMEWTALWHHERLTGNAKTEVSKKLLVHARALRYEV